MCGTFRCVLRASGLGWQLVRPRGPSPSARLGMTRMGRAARLYTRKQRRCAPPREYFTGLRFGSIFVRPVPLFTSMIWSRSKAARSNSRLAEAVLHLVF
jgi:hypothetical protein